MARQRDYAFMAEFDFLVANAQTREPVFTVEDDGPQHLEDAATIERDAIKDTLCRLADFPLLRVDSAATRREGRWRVLEYILNAYDLQKAFQEAQERGHVPWDEAFNHESLIVFHPDGGLMFDTLDAEALRYLHKAKKQGVLQRTILRLAYGRSDGQAKAYAYTHTVTGHVLVAKVSVRHYAFPGVPSCELAQELAVADLADLANRYTLGEAVASRPDVIDSLSEWLPDSDVSCCVNMPSNGTA